MTKKLVETLDALTSIPTFQALVDAAVKVANKRIMEREHAENLLKVAQIAEAEQRRALTRLNKCWWYAGEGWTYNPMEWREQEGGGAVKKSYKLETPDYSFILMLKATDLKRTPYEVVADIRKTELPINPQDIHGGYRMDGYGKEKYGEELLTTRYKTLAGAEGACEYWKTKLYKDHAAEIDFCRYLRKLAIEGGTVFTENENFIRWNHRG